MIVSLGAVILGAVFMRIIPHAPNVSPIAALALFSGVMIPGWGMFVIPLVAMVLSDMVIGFHSTVPFVYGSFLLIVALGYVLKKHNNFISITLASLFGSVLFFIITNFGSWATTNLYQKNLSGLMHSYEMGLPFFRNTLIGDLLYTGAFFVGFAVLKLLFVLMLPSTQKVERHVGNTV